ncbi:MAG: ATPase [Lachnospiraceae bacterium]
MSSNKIEQLIDNIYEYIESCKPKGFSTSQVIVPKDELYDLLDELRLRVPDEIKRCQKMLVNRDAILANAQEQADKIIADAKLQAETLVHDSEIMRQAYLQANEMVSRATQEADSIMQAVNRDAEQIRTGALAYTNDMLAEMERVMSMAYEDTRNKSEALLTSIRQNLDIVSENRRELCEDVAPQAAEAPAKEQTPEEYYAGDDDTAYDDLNGDDFLRNID